MANDDVPQKAAPSQLVSKKSPAQEQQKKMSPGEEMESEWQQIVDYYDPANVEKRAEEARKKELQALQSAMEANREQEQILEEFYGIKPRPKQSLEELEKAAAEVAEEDEWNFPQDPDKWTEADLGEEWADAPADAKVPFYDPLLGLSALDAADDDADADDGRRRRKAPRKQQRAKLPHSEDRYVPYRQGLPPVNEMDDGSSGALKALEELEMEEEFLQWASYVFRDGATYYVQAPISFHHPSPYPLFSPLPPRVLPPPAIPAAGCGCPDGRYEGTVWNGHGARQGSLHHAARALQVSFVHPVNDEYNNPHHINSKQLLESSPPLHAHALSSVSSHSPALLPNSFPSVYRCVCTSNCAAMASSPSTSLRASRRQTPSEPPRNPMRSSFPAVPLFPSFLPSWFLAWRKLKAEGKVFEDEEMSAEDREWLRMELEDLSTQEADAKKAGAGGEGAGAVEDPTDAVPFEDHPGWLKGKFRFGEFLRNKDECDAHTSGVSAPRGAALGGSQDWDKRMDRAERVAVWAAPVNFAAVCMPCHCASSPGSLVQRYAYPLPRHLLTLPSFPSPPALPGQFHAGMARVAAAKARMFVNKPDGSKSLPPLPPACRSSRPPCSIHAVRLFLPLHGLPSPLTMNARLFMRAQQGLPTIQPRPAAVMLPLAPPSPMTPITSTPNSFTTLPSHLPPHACECSGARVVREVKGPYNEPSHPYLYDEDDMWQAPGFIHEFHAVPAVWRKYADEVDGERQLWLNSFKKAPLRLPSPSELSYLWDQKEEFVVLRNSPRLPERAGESAEEAEMRRADMQGQVLVHVPSRQIINWTTDEEGKLRLFVQPFTKDGKVDPSKARPLPLGFDEFIKGEEMEQEEEEEEEQEESEEARRLKTPEQLQRDAQRRRAKAAEARRRRVARWERALRNQVAWRREQREEEWARQDAEEEELRRLEEEEWQREGDLMDAEFEARLDAAEGILPAGDDEEEEEEGAQQGQEEDAAGKGAVKGGAATGKAAAGGSGAGEEEEGSESESEGESDDEDEDEDERKPRSFGTVAMAVGGGEGREEGSAGEGWLRGPAVAGSTTVFASISLSSQVDAPACPSELTYKSPCLCSHLTTLLPTLLTSPSLPTALALTVRMPAVLPLTPCLRASALSSAARRAPVARSSSRGAARASQARQQQHSQEVAVGGILSLALPLPATPSLA
ncbi:unnamed protein product [Closterium sp. NIES-64]|nr:unnamed protein product [Closterium sp. NIES-64]